MLSKSAMVLATLAAIMIVARPAGVSAAGTPALNADILHVALDWEHIKFGVENADEQEKEMAALAERAGKLVQQYPNQPEPTIWQGVLISEQASMANENSSMKIQHSSRQRRERRIGAVTLYRRTLRVPVYSAATPIVALGGLSHPWRVGSRANGESRSRPSFARRSIAASPTRPTTAVRLDAASSKLPIWRFRIPQRSARSLTRSGPGARDRPRHNGARLRQGCRASAARAMSRARRRDRRRCRPGDHVGGGHPGVRPREGPQARP